MFPFPARLDDLLYPFANALFFADGSLCLVLRVTLFQCSQNEGAVGLAVSGYGIFPSLNLYPTRLLSASPVLGIDAPTVNRSGFLNISVRVHGTLSLAGGGR